MLATVNRYAVVARQKKAFALAETLRAAGISRSMASEADAGDWALVAQTAGVKLPSAETVALVLSLLDQPAEMPEPECSCQRVDADVYDPSGCELHGDSAYRRSVQVEREPIYTAGDGPDECPF